MAFGYNPKDASGCLEKGTYDAELTSVEEKKSKSGSDMLAIVWTVPFNGKDYAVKDYIVASNLFKLKNIAQAWGMFREFEERQFDLAEHIHRSISIRLDVDSNPIYGDKNSIVGYAAASGPVMTQQAPPAPPDANEEPDAKIPF